MTTDFLRPLIARLKRWNHRRATVQALHELSDWQLRDLGLSRGEIPAIVEAAFAPKEQAYPTHAPPGTHVRLHRQAPTERGPAVAA
jgi:uncharacterized protein YjiS (DUF1127 family)